MSRACHLRITEPSRLRDVLSAAYQMAGRMLAEVGPIEVIIRQIKSQRSLEQNALMWALLGDVARQVRWQVNGVEQQITADEWKDIFSASLNQDMRVADGLYGGVVLLGRRTSKMSVREMKDMIELIQLFGDERGVIWSASDKYVPEQWRSA